MSLRKNLQESLDKQRIADQMAALAKREAMLSIRNQLAQRIGYARGALDADDWAGARIQFEYVIHLLAAMEENDAARA